MRGLPNEIIGMVKMGVSFDSDIWMPIDMIKPIPLTPEILEKCGIELKDGNYKIDLSIGDLYFNENDGISFAVTVGYEYSETQMEHIKYLHQLQNLYFSLEGEELKVTL
jgi:hypothetical protein